MTGAIAVGYIRAASISQLDPRSGLDVQEELIRAFAEAEGIKLNFVFEDVGISAHNMRRPGLLALLDAVGSNQASLVIVADLTRLARSIVDLSCLTNSLARQGVSIVAANEPRSH
jgi:DNA invertase Pin-like site-specific DNA recombinase